MASIRIADILPMLPLGKAAVAHERVYLFAYVTTQE